MLTLYVLCAVAGAGFAVLSALLGGDSGHDHGDGGDLGGDAGAPGDAHDLAHAAGDGAGGGGHDDGGHDGDHGHTWIPILSLQFWTYAMAGFGLTGLLARAFTNASLAQELATAIPVGLACGFAISLAMRKLRESSVGSGISHQQIIGSEGKLVLPAAPGQPGKIALSVGEQSLEIIAEPAGSENLGVGEAVVVIDIKDSRARVVRTADMAIAARKESV